MALGGISVSLDIISNSVGLDRVLSCNGGGGDIGLRRPAVSAELNLLRGEGKPFWAVAAYDPIAEGEQLILRSKSSIGADGGGLEAAQRRESSGEITM